MDRYKNGKIYKIIDNTNNNIYIGSTCEPTLALRLAKHKSKYKQYLKGNTHANNMTSYKILENNNYSIILLEEYSCETKDQLLLRERYYIDNNICVNKCVPLRTNKEYNEENKEKIQKYRDDRKEIKKEYDKKYRENKKEKYVCDCGGKYILKHKTTHQKSNKHLKFLEDNKL